MLLLHAFQVLLGSSSEKKGGALRIRQPGSHDNVEEEEYGESNFLLEEGRKFNKRTLCSVTKISFLFEMKEQRIEDDEQSRSRDWMNREKRIAKIMGTRLQEGDE
jgi:hypothetical protein